jgi:hypothetical protein
MGLQTEKFVKHSSLQDVKDAFDQAIADSAQQTSLAQTATTNANSATSSANNAAISANSAASTANNAAIFANQYDYKGDWTNGSEYKKNNSVRYLNATYVANKDIPSSTINPETATNDWDVQVDVSSLVQDTNTAKNNAISATVLANQTKYKGLWASGTDYKENNSVKFGNTLYRANKDITNSTNNPSIATSDWDKGLDVTDIVSDVTTVKNDTITAKNNAEAVANGEVSFISAKRKVNEYDNTLNFKGLVDETSNPSNPRSKDAYISIYEGFSTVLGVYGVGYGDLLYYDLGWKVDKVFNFKGFLDLNGGIYKTSDFGSTFDRENLALRTQPTGITGASNVASPSTDSIPMDIDVSGGFSLQVRFKVENYIANSRLFSSSTTFPQDSPSEEGIDIYTVVANGAFGNDNVHLVMRCLGNTNVAIDTGLLEASFEGVEHKLYISVDSGRNVTAWLNGTSLTLNGGFASQVAGLGVLDKPFYIGNHFNEGDFDRGLDGFFYEFYILPTTGGQTEADDWNSGTLDVSGALFSVDFSNLVHEQSGVVYYLNDSREITHRSFSDGTDIKTEKLSTSNTWSPYSTGGGTGDTYNITNNNTLVDGKAWSPRNGFDLQTDGWGTSDKPTASNNALVSGTYEFINTGVDTSASVGEAFHGLAGWNEWLIQAPQDHHSAVCFNTITRETVEIDLSAYVRAIPAGADNFRDKFNGVAADPDGIHIWLAPSWTTHVVKINMNSFSIASDYLVNSNRDDAYNGIIVTDKYVFPVTHSKEDLPRITKSDGTIDIFSITEDVAGDYNMDEASVSNNRSFLGGHNGGDGFIWLHPRRSKYLVKVNEETGAIVEKYQHPLAGQTDPSWGYFHGASRVGNKIYFSPWGFANVVIFDIVNETWQNIDISSGISGSQQWCFGSTSDGRFVYFFPFKASEVIKIDTFDSDKVYYIDASAPISDFETVFSRTDNGFAGGSVVKDGCVWVSSSLEASYIKIPIKELGSLDVRSNGKALISEEILTKKGEFYLGHKEFRIKLVGSQLKIQYWNGSAWADSTGGTFAKN